MTTTLYATSDELALRLRTLNLTAGAQDEEIATMQSALYAASRRIDDDTGRRFWQDAALSDRYYSVTHIRKVVVDDISTVTGLVVATGSPDSGYSVLSPNTYLLKPDGAIADGEPAELIERIGSYQFVVGHQLKVTAKFGWSDVVPDPIHEACLLMASRLYRRKDSPDAYVKGVGGEGLARVTRIDPDYDALIKRYVRPY